MRDYYDLIAFSSSTNIKGAFEMLTGVSLTSTVKSAEEGLRGRKKERKKIYQKLRPKKITHIFRRLSHAPTQEDFHLHKNGSTQEEYSLN